MNDSPERGGPRCDHPPCCCGHPEHSHGWASKPGPRALDCRMCKCGGFQPRGHEHLITDEEAYLLGQLSVVGSVEIGRFLSTRATLAAFARVVADQEKAPECVLCGRTFTHNPWCVVPAAKTLLDELHGKPPGDNRLI